MSKGHENLVKPRSTDEAREWGRNGGIASGKSRREKKTVSEIIDRCLNTPVTDKAILDDIKKSGLPVPREPVYRDYIVAKILVRTAAKGTISDLRELMNLLGEAPMKNDDDLLRNARFILAEIDSVI